MSSMDLGNDDVEAGNAPLLGNGSQIYGNEKDIADSKEARYWYKPGIAFPPRKRFRFFFLVRWFIYIGILNMLFATSLRAMTTQTQIQLSEDTKNIFVDLEHCNLHLMASDIEGPGMVVVQHWNFLGGSVVLPEGDSVSITAHMSASLVMFRCLVSVRVHPDYPIKSLSAHLTGEPMSRAQIDIAPTESLNLRMHDTAFMANELSAKNNITIMHGSVIVNVDNLPKETDLIVLSNRAPVYVETDSPIHVHLKGNASATSVFSGSAVNHLEGSALIAGAPGTHQLNVHFETPHEATGHFLSATSETLAQGGLTTTRGALQDAAEPILTESSKMQLEKATQWMDIQGKSARPWVVKMRIRNPGLPCGSWQIVSSEAYFVVKLEFLSLISGTLLQPELTQATLEFLGMKEDWPPKVRDDQGGACIYQDFVARDDPTMMKMFDVLIKDIVPPVGATLAWVPDDTDGVATPVTFHSRAGLWRTSYHKPLSGQSALFLAALGLNTVASTVLAAVLLFFLTRYGKDAIMSRLMRDTVTVAASQRITLRQTGSSWRMFATFIDHPHGVTLRWTKQTGDQRPTYLWIKAEESGVGDDEVTIENVKHEKVPTMKENSAISEFFFSVDHLQKGNIYDPSQRYFKNLQTMVCYRFCVEALDAEENIIMVSEWSNEVFIAPQSSVFEMPLFLVKELCPVPTDSLGYFLDHFADRHVDGKTPQQILVLSNISIEFHRNFKDLQFCDEDFYLSVYTGTSRDASEKETSGGRVKTYAMTDKFKAPKDLLNGSADFLDDDQKTVRLSSKSLQVGRVSDEMKDLTIRMHWFNSGDDVAEATVDWGDFMWEFEQDDSAKGGSSKPQTIEIDLVCGPELGYDEDYLVCLTAEISFVNSIDKKCIELPRESRFFVEDAPGQVFYKGMERFVTWDPDSASFESPNFDVYIFFPDLPEKVADEDPRSKVNNPRLLNADVAKGSVGFGVMMDFPSSLTNKKWVAAQILARDPEGNQALSHRFIICQTWLRSDMEMMYASFCKMNSVAMQNLDSESFTKFGLSTISAPLKVVPNLREALAFEDQGFLYESPGTFLIREDDIHVIHGDVETEAAGADDVSAAGAGSVGSAEVGSTQKTKTASSSTSKDEGPKAAEKTCIVTAQRQDIMQSIWPASFMFPASAWVPTVLLVYDFYPVDNIVEFLAWVCELTRIDTLFAALQAIVGAHYADRFLNLLLGPLYYVLPFFAESLLFYLQYVVFMLLPALMLAVGCAIEYVKSVVNRESILTTSGLKVDACLPDVMFSSNLSGTDIHIWLDNLPLPSKILLFGSAGMYCILFVFLLETNFVREMWPRSLQTAMRTFFNKSGEALIHSCLFVLFFFICMTGLWFMMAVVIYPQEMMVALSGVGGLGFIGWSMVARYRASKDQIQLFLKQEVPDILDLICDNFLMEFDRQDLMGPSQNRIRLGDKLADVSRGELRKYLDKRFDMDKLAMTSGNKKGEYKNLPTNQLFAQIFDRALLRAEDWRALSGGGGGGGGGGVFSSITGGAKGGSGGPPDPDQQVKTTEQILIESGLQQEDTSTLEHFTMRVRISDRETELRDKSVHSYSEDQRQKLMSVFVRCLDGLPMQPDVEAVLDDPKMLGRAIYRAQKSKLEVFDRARLEQRGSAADKISLLELFISDVNQRELKKYEFIIAEHLDEVLDATKAAEKIASFLWREAPLEIQKQMRLTLDEHCVGSSMQRVFEDLRRWKSKILREQGDAGLRQNLMLGSVPQRGGPSQGLLGMLEHIRVVDRQASLDYRFRVWKMLERKVNEFKDEEEKEYVINPNDLESFVRELLGGQLWWGAMSEFLYKIGFPIDKELPPGQNEQPATRSNILPRATVRLEFEKFSGVMKNGGFLPKDKIFDFLRELTRADSTDGGFGRIWKSLMIKLMQKLQICGQVNVDNAGSAKSKKSKGLSKNDQQAESLADLAVYEWPRWLKQAWGSKAKAWRHKDDTTSDEMKPFMPKSELYAFLQEVAFNTADQQQDTRDFEGVKVDDDYDNWRKVKDRDGYTSSIWSLRGKVLMELRGVWQECFFHILDKMSNPVTDRQKGLLLFEICRQDQQKYLSEHPMDPAIAKVEREGLVHVNFLFFWLRKNLVQNSGECSLEVLQKVLERCELTLPRIVVTSLYHSARPTENFQESWPLRKVSDLEDRIVMYLVKGLPAEACESLIFDVISVPSLQDISKAELKHTFRSIDNKLGTNGFLEPREIKALIVHLGQAGMNYNQVLVALKRLGCDFPEKQVKEAFLLLDTSGDDLMDMPEFLGLMDYIIVRLIPQEILRVMGLEPQQVVLRLIFAVLTLMAVFLFIFVSLGAFHVEIEMSSQSSASGASMVRAGLALLAVVALKRDASEEDEERFFKNARERLYAMMGVTHSQIDARRRAMGISLGSIGRPGGLAAGSKGPGKFKMPKGKGGGDDDGDDDGGDDD